MIAGLIVFPMSNVFAQEDESWINIPIGNSALWIEIDNGKAYVTNPTDGKIAVIDINSKKIIEF